MIQLKQKSKSMPFEFIPTEIADVILIKPKIYKDSRGFFMETFKASGFADAGINAEFIQDNQSRSVKGVLRGLHYQLPPAAQAKLVRCLTGKIFDVAVDIRKNSATYGQWVGAALSAETGEMLYIPQGFAHGFLTLSETANVLYKVSGNYSPQHERGIIWNDADIGIAWPEGDVLLSEKDEMNPGLKDADVF